MSINAKKPTEETTLMLELLSAAMFNRQPIALPKDAEQWDKVLDAAVDGAVSAVCYTPVSRLENADISPESLAALRADAVNTANNYYDCLYSQKKIISVLEKNGIDCAVWKGLSASALYPCPELRRLGDIDILVRPDDFDRAVKIFTDMGAVCPFSDAESSVSDIAMILSGTYFELHRFFTDDCLLGEEFYISALDNAREIELEGFRFKALSEPYNAYSMLLHMRHHFIGTGFGLRQLADYALVLSRLSGSELSELSSLAEKAGMTDFLRCVAKTCVLCLGADEKAAQVLSAQDFPEDVCDAFLCDIIDGGTWGQLDPDRENAVHFRNGGGAAKSLLKSLGASARRQYPACREHKILLPFCCVAAGFGAVKNRVTGKRSRFDVGKAKKSYDERAALFREMGINAEEIAGAHIERLKGSRG